MQTDPQLVAQALAILQNSSHHGLVLVAITGKNQVNCVVVSERMTDMALDQVGMAAGRAVRDALETVAIITRQTRQN